MSQVPQFIKGISVVTAVVPVTAVASDGTPTFGASEPTAGLLESVEFEFTNEDENFQPMDVSQANHAIIGRDWSCVLTEINNPSMLLISNGFGEDYAKITCLIGGKTLTLVGMIKGGRLQQPRGKGTSSLTLLSAGIAPTYA